MGATGRDRIAALLTTGALDTGWTSAANQPVNALLVVKGADVYVGGEFTQLGGTARNHLGSLDLANGALQTWDPNLDGDGTALHLQSIIQSRFPTIQITRLARGLPAGSNIEFANRNILADAISGRQKM